MMTKEEHAKFLREVDERVLPRREWETDEEYAGRMRNFLNGPVLAEALRLFEENERYRSAIEEILATTGDGADCRGIAAEALERPRGCKHWPGQKRCEVCGMGVVSAQRREIPMAPGFTDEDDWRICPLGLDVSDCRYPDCDCTRYVRPISERK